MEWKDKEQKGNREMVGAFPVNQEFRKEKQLENFSLAGNEDF